jgi:hypothetical protein
MGIKNTINIGLTTQATPTAITRAGSVNGLFPVTLWAGPSSDFTLLAQLGVQPVFPTTIDVVTLEANTTYLMTGQYILNTGATTHTTAMAFALGGSASVTSFEYLVNMWSSAINTISTTQSSTHVSGVASKVLNATSTAVWTLIQFTGMVRMNAGGTITPQINFSANPTGTNLTKVGSFIQFVPIGTGSVVSTSTAFG